jgi:general secretion pathway protein D
MMLWMGAVAAASGQESSDVPAPAEAAQAESRLTASLLQEGVAKYRTGDYEASITIFDTILTMDPYHDAAITFRKRASERIAAREAAKTKVMRTEALAEIEAAWTPSLKVAAVPGSVEAGLADRAERDAAAAMEARLKSVPVAEFDFTEASVVEVVRFFAEAGRNGLAEDIDFLLVGLDPADEIPITPSLDNTSVYEALQYVVEMGSLKFRLTEDMVIIMPASYVPAAQMVIKSYDIIPEVGADLSSAMDSGGGGDDLFGASSGGDASGGPVDVSDFFALVDFPEGASAVYQPRFHKLFVKNTPVNIKAVETVLSDLNERAVQRRSQQVEIEAKFVEFNEGALEELGFDWTAYGSGSVAGFEGKDGTYFQKSSGYTEEIDIADDSGSLGGALYTSPVTGQQLITDPNGQNIFGSAQRDNTSAFDVIGSGVAATLGGAPSAMVFGNGDVDVRIAALEQQGTADVLSAPRVTAKSGTEATIRVAETHRYPQDYDVTTGQRTSPVVRPQDWEDFDMGVQLRVIPVVDAESSTIALELYPEILKFKGYEDYIVGYNAYDAGGNDSSAGGGDGSPFLTRMPFFERRYIETQITIADGQTIGLAGLTYEKTETFRDQVPLLGDIPYVGRLFRTEGSRSSKKNLTIFVKASQVDARGMTRADRERMQQTAAR